MEWHPHLSRWPGERWVVRSLKELCGARGHISRRIAGPGIICEPLKSSARYGIVALPLAYLPSRYKLSQLLYLCLYNPIGEWTRPLRAYRHLWPSI